MIVRRLARDDFMALRICQIIDDFGGNVFSVTYDGNQYIVWAKVTHDKLADIDGQLEHVYGS